MSVHNAEIEEIVVDANGGPVFYGVLSFGGVSGLGNKLFAIPWPSLRLTDGVSFSQDKWPNLVDQRWATDLYAHYNVGRYWTVGPSERGTENP